MIFFGSAALAPRAAFFDARNFYGSGSLTRVLPEGRFLTGSHNGSLGVRGEPVKKRGAKRPIPGRLSFACRLPAPGSFV